MELKDEIRLEASREAVWEALNDPEILKVCIPGCENLEKISDTEFVSLVVIKVGPIKAKFAGKVTLSDIVAPTSYRLTGEGQGGVAGFAKADITVELTSESPATTLLKYGVTANIGGKIAQLGSRMIDSTARKMADQFFERFNEAVRGRSAEEAASAAGADAAGGEAVAGAASAAGASPGSATAGTNDILVTMIDVTEENGWDNEASTIPTNDAGGGIGKKLAHLLGLSGAEKSDASSAPGTSVAKTPLNSPAKSASAPAAVHKAAVVTINRPKHKNCVSLAMWNDLARIFTELGRDPQVRAIIFKGAGGNFSAGADISEFATVRATVEQGVSYEVAVDACCDAIAATPKPTIAVIEGYCMGGGCHLAMSCDFRISAADAQFGIPAARLSIVYGVRGTQRLLALVGLSNAKKILYSARKFSAAEARGIGFLDRIASDPMRAAKSFAAVMADNAPLTIAGTKVLLNGLSMGLGTLDDAIVNEVVERAVASEDYRDARQAFVEKRQPVFLGK